MNTTATIGSSSRDDLAALLRADTSFQVAKPQNQGPDAAPSKDADPATIVDLSDSAKAMLERNKADQLVADQLEQQLADAKGDGKSDSTSKLPADDAAELFGSLSGRSTPQNGQTPEGVKDFGNYTAAARTANTDTLDSSGPKLTPDTATIVSLSPQAQAAIDNSDDPAADESTFGDHVVLQAAHTGGELAAIRQKGRETLLLTAVQQENPKGADTLRAALANGTVKTQMAADVPGVNYKTQVSYTQGLLGRSETHTATFNPSPEVQAAIDLGRAMVMWQRDVGDVYITW